MKHNDHNSRRGHSAKKGRILSEAKTKQPCCTPTTLTHGTTFAVIRNAGKKSKKAGTPEITNIHRGKREKALTPCAQNITII